jgi:hypothetical protein
MALVQEDVENVQRLESHHGRLLKVVQRNNLLPHALEALLRPAKPRTENTMKKEMEERRRSWRA